MNEIIQQVQTTIEACVGSLPVGTNQNICQLAYTMLSGKFLESRGALFPALSNSGYDEQTCRRISATLRTGVFSEQEIIDNYRKLVFERDGYRRIERQGYHANNVDLTHLGRPRLQTAKGKYFSGQSGKAIPAIGGAVICEVGYNQLYSKEPIAVIKEVVTEQGLDEAGQEKLQELTLKRVARELEHDAIAVTDAGNKPKQLQTTGMPRYITRAAQNATFRRNELPQKKSNRGRPAEKGEVIRPCKRVRKAQEIAASRPDETKTFTHRGRQIRVKIWKNVVLPDQKVSPENELLNVFVYDDPAYGTPLILTTNVLELLAEVVFEFYLGRWLVEHPPLVSKQLLGMQRQFLFNAMARERCFALGLIFGNVLTWLARNCDAIPTGFWDRRPKQTPGRLRRFLAKRDFSKLNPINQRISKKSPSLRIYQKVFWLTEGKNLTIWPEIYSLT